MTARICSPPLVLKNRVDDAGNSVFEMLEILTVSEEIEDKDLCIMPVLDPSMQLSTMPWYTMGSSTSKTSLIP